MRSTAFAETNNWTDRVPCVTETNNKVCISRIFLAEFYAICSPYNMVGIFVRLILFWQFWGYHRFSWFSKSDLYRTNLKLVVWNVTFTYNPIWWKQSFNFVSPLPSQPAPGSPSGVSELYSQMILSRSLSSDLFIWLPRKGVHEMVSRQSKVFVRASFNFRK